MSEFLSDLLWVLVSLAAVAAGFGVIAMGTRPDSYFEPDGHGPRASAAPPLHPADSDVEQAQHRAA